MTPDTPDQEPKPPSPAGPPQGQIRDENLLPRVSSSQLFGGASRLVISHEGQEYVLLITRNRRLVLNRWR